MSSPIADAGTFDSNSDEAAAAVLHAVLNAPGSWCNLEFQPIDDGAAGAGDSFFGFIAARGPMNPLATVMASTAGKKPKPAEIGIQHHAGVKAAAQLTEAGLSLPAGARVVQDHPRRGLVVRCEEGIDAAGVVAWLIPAMRILSRQPATTVVNYVVTAGGS